MKQKSNEDYKKISLELPRDDYEVLRVAAFETRHSVSSLIRFILKQGVFILKEEGYNALGLQKDEYIEKIKKNIKKSGR